MVEYDYLELLKAIRMCASNPRYGVIVFTGTERRAEVAFDEAVDAITHDEETRQILDTYHKRHGEYAITYCNGSIMRFSLLKESSRGYRANCIIYDSSIDTRILRDLAFPMERPYMEENNGTSRRI